MTDFDHFCIQELKREVGKNINIKVHKEKAVRFLHHCFSQFKNSHTNLAIELVDIVGETFGKKYDFR